MKILAIGAHYDDIEINCAGSLLKERDRGAEVTLIVCTDGSLGGDSSQRRDEQELVNGVMGYKQVIYLGHKDGSLVHDSELVSELDQAIEDIQPDYIVTHNVNDTHQDHAAVAKSVRSANRNAHAGLIVFPGNDVKTPFTTNLFVDITQYFEKKLGVIGFYETQDFRPWLDTDMVTARSIGTGIAKYVEKFHIEFMKL